MMWFFFPLHAKHSLYSVVGRTVVSRRRHILIPGSWEYVAWKQGLKVADEIKIVYHLTLKWGRLFRIIWVGLIIKSLVTEEGRRVNVRLVTSRWTSHCWLCRGEAGLKPRRVGPSPEPLQRQKSSLPWSFQKKKQPCWHLDFISMRHILGSDLQNCTIIKLC